MHETENTDRCNRPTCICCQGYEAVKQYEEANGIKVETIELNHEDLLQLKQETGSWFVANRMLVKQHYIDANNHVFADAVQKEIDNYLARQEKE